MFTWLQYVTHDKVDEFIALGWKVDDKFAAVHHGEFSILMSWHGEGEPPQPKHLRVVS